MKYIEVYHSSNSINSTDQIIREGFNPNYIGTSYGSSFGKGFYFSPSYEYTCTYNTENPYLIKCSINVSEK